MSSLVTQRTLDDYQHECERCGVSSDDVEKFIGSQLCWECRLEATDELIEDIEADLSEGL